MEPSVLSQTGGAQAWDSCCPLALRLTLGAASSPPGPVGSLCAVSGEAAAGEALSPWQFFQKLVWNAVDGSKLLPLKAPFGYKSQKIDSLSSIKNSKVSLVLWCTPVTQWLRS